MRIMLPFVPHSFFGGASLGGGVFIVMIVFAVLISLIIANVLKTKYLSFVIGKGFWKNFIK